VVSLHWLQERAFDVLRTKEQLGYVVFLFVNSHRSLQSSGRVSGFGMQRMSLHPFLLLRRSIVCVRSADVLSLNLLVQSDQPLDFVSERMDAFLHVFEVRHNIATRIAAALSVVHCHHFRPTMRPLRLLCNIEGGAGEHHRQRAERGAQMTVGVTLAYLSTDRSGVPKLPMVNHPEITVRSVAQCRASALRTTAIAKFAKFAKFSIRLSQWHGTLTHAAKARAECAQVEAV
jgi:hypothetical protein